MLVSIKCPSCKQVALKEIGAVNRARRKNAPIYCGKKCSGLGRRVDRTQEEKAAIKKEYDALYRVENRALLKVKKARWFKAAYDPKKAAEKRKENMWRHVEYCRQPEYKKRKSAYDRVFLAKKNYGDFWEVKIAAMDLEGECLERMDRYEMDLLNGKLNKLNNRRKLHENVNSREFEKRALGHAESDQRE